MYVHISYCLSHGALNHATVITSNINFSFLVYMYICLCASYNTGSLFMYMHIYVWYLHICRYM